MDSQKTNSFGLNTVSQFDGFNFQSLTSSTNTDVTFSYDADWEIQNHGIRMCMIISLKRSEIGN